MVVGTVVTVLAAYLPARRASKVAPIAAMRDVAVDSSGHSRRRAVIGTVLTGLGARAAGRRCGWRRLRLRSVLGALAVFAGVVVLGPVVGPRFVRIVGAPVAAFRGMTGVLARDNAARNPKRTAATASALMIGVALVVLISVFAASARSSIDANIDNASAQRLGHRPAAAGRPQPDGRAGGRRTARDRPRSRRSAPRRSRSTARRCRSRGSTPPTSSSTSTST